MSPICVLYVWQRDFGVNRILHCYSWIHARPNCMVYWTLLCMANVLVLHCYITICMQLQFLQWSLGIWLKKKGHLQSSFLDGNNHPEEVLDIDDRHKRTLFVSFRRKPPIWENELDQFFRYMYLFIYVLYMSIS